MVADSRFGPDGCGLRDRLPLHKEYVCLDLRNSAATTAVVWRVAAGLLPGQSLPPVVLSVLEKGYRRERNVHEYAYSVLLSTFYEPSWEAAREGIRRVIAVDGIDAEICRFMRRFWQERSSEKEDQKTGGTGGARRYRLRRLWLTWNPNETADFMEFVRMIAAKFAAQDPSLGWPAVVYDRVASKA